VADPEDDIETMVECRACGGRWQLAGHVCRWCSQGLMSRVQMTYWIAHKSGLRPAVRVDDPSGATGASG